ncbi:putative membrane protein [Rhodococcus sp. MTM3W5.2]|nr:putative membrane protein [Rhodococcus sp. MTM3W5.2]
MSWSRARVLMRIVTAPVVVAAAAVLQVPAHAAAAPASDWTLPG